MKKQITCTCGYARVREHTLHLALRPCMQLSIDAVRDVLLRCEENLHAVERMSDFCPLDQLFVFPTRSGFLAWFLGGWD